MTSPSNFSIGAEGYWVLLRLLLGFLSAVFSQLGRSNPGFILWAAITLVLCVWLDAVTGWAFRHFGPKSSETAALETYADFVCFVAAPNGFAAVLAMSAWPIAVLPLFLLAAVYRLARFQIQGLVGKGYLGLPVTYIGYLFPLAGLAIHFLPGVTDVILISLLVLTSALMVSSHFTVPEF